MSRFFPHTLYAEDQPDQHTILAFHALHRGFQLGAGLGVLLSAPIYFSARLLPLTSTLRTRILSQSFRTHLLKSTGLGALFGFGLLTLGLEGRMHGREDIEWRDRSWRLRENRGQMEVDDLALLGTAAGFVLVRRRGWKMRLGGAAVGNLVGLAVYMGWRHGVMGGVWKEGGFEL